ncbi:unnamed protein product [Diabrotica balteata]|uniref:Regulatory protein zeste n=1 Tax=Diabrotica balteata TaxID=107213 RepID=A0A9N9TE36_DIABA|nr:unnamed protein product [Diabrotica balteata]
MDKSKKRSTNFSKEEELCLLQEIEKYKDIVECKTTKFISGGASFVLETESVKKRRDIWRCIQRNTKCSAKVFTIGCDDLTITRSDLVHNHEADPKKLEVKMVTNACKRKAQEDISEKPAKITRTAVAECDANLLMVPDIASIRKNIYNCRRKLLPGPLPKSISEVHNAEEAWQKFLTNFNAKNMVWRTVEQVKNKYDNIKTRTRKVVAKEKSYLRGTGGGPEIKTLEDPVIVATLRIINEKTVVGLKTILDSDETIQTNYVWENIPSTSEEKIPDKVRKKPKTEEKTNWSTYVPNNLQTPRNKKLLPKIRNPVFSAKEQYYRRKYILLLRTFKAEEKERRKRMEREEKNYKAEEEGRKIEEGREKNL